MKRKEYEKELVKLQTELYLLQEWVKHAGVRAIVVFEGHARLNCIAHVLKLIPHKKVPHDKVKLPKRSKEGEYDDKATLKGRTFVPERY